MKYILLLAGVAALGIAAPAAADPGHGHGNGHSKDQGRDNGWNRDDGDQHRGNRDDGRWNRHDNGHHYGWQRGRGNPHRWARGDRWQPNYGTYYTYNRIPYRVRHQYDLNSRYRYYYNNGSLYAVDPRTMMIQQVISALLR